MYDFAGLIFDHFVDTISGRSRPPYVTFPSFIGLFLQHLGNGYAGDPEDEMSCPSMSSRLFSAAPQEGDPHLTAEMFDWIAHPYSADPRPVNFVPILVEPLAQQPGDQPQPAAAAHPQPTGDATTTADSSSSSSHDRQSPLHQSPAATPSGNTDSVHLTQSEAATTFSHPSSESPIITRPPPQQVPHQIPSKSPTPRRSPSKGESHHTIPTHVSPIPQNTQPQGLTADFQSTVLQLLNTMNQRLHLLETDVAVIKNHLLPEPSAHHTSPPPSHTTPPPPPPPPPSGPPPRQPTPPREPQDASHVSDSLSSQFDAAKGEKSQAEGEQQKQPAQAEGEHQK